MAEQKLKEGHYHIPTVAPTRVIQRVVSDMIHELDRQCRVHSWAGTARERLVYLVQNTDNPFGAICFSYNDVIDAIKFIYGTTDPNWFEQFAEHKPPWFYFRISVFDILDCGPLNVASPLRKTMHSWIDPEMPYMSQSQLKKELARLDEFYNKWKKLSSDNSIQCVPM